MPQSGAQAHDPEIKTGDELDAQPTGHPTPLPGVPEQTGNWMTLEISSSTEVFFLWKKGKTIFLTNLVQFILDGEVMKTVTEQENIALFSRFSKINPKKACFPFLCCIRRTGAYQHHFSALKF